MKKLIVLFSFLLLTVSANALSLFPFFVDLVGNYSDGPVEKLQPLEIECLSSDKCNDFNTIEGADTFLLDVLPFSNYHILRKKMKMKGLDMEVYATLQEDGKTSVMCLIEIPEDGLYVTYDEIPGNPFQIEE